MNMGNCLVNFNIFVNEFNFFLNEGKKTQKLFINHSIKFRFSVGFKSFCVLNKHDFVLINFILSPPHRSVKISSLGTNQN
jgi:hypothetical protein